MSNGNASDDSGRQKRTHFATPAAPSGETIKKTRGSPISAAREHVNSHAGTLHNKVTKFFVHCAADFMTRRQNIQYNISSQHKVKSENEYVPKSSQIKLGMAVEKVTK